MRPFKIVLSLGFILCSTQMFSQYLPPSYQPMLNEIVTNFETITGSNSITQGKNTLSVIDKDKVALRIEHKKKVKNLTFETKLDEENKRYWAAANDLTIDMVNKYEKDLTKILKSMHSYSEKKSKE